MHITGENELKKHTVTKSTNINNVLNLTTQKLKNRVFSGLYQERRLFEPLLIYKDVIVVENGEHEFIKDLSFANELIKTYFNGQIITCISDLKSDVNGINYLIWTDLTRVAFGTYWFTIKNVIIEKNTINIVVKCLRPINVESNSPLSNEKWADFNIFDTIKSIARNISEIATMENIIYSLRFLLVLLLTGIVGCYHLLLLLLHFFHEFSYFIRSLTPVLIAAIESLTKMFGGLLMLIAMMWNNRGTKQWSSNTQTKNPQITYHNNIPNNLRRPTYKIN